MPGGKYSKKERGLSVTEKSQPNQDARQTEPQKKRYCKPRLEKAGSLTELTQGFDGSVPDEQGGMTKVNPFTG